MRNSDFRHNRAALLTAGLVLLAQTAGGDEPFRISREDLVTIRADTAWEDVVPDTVHFSGGFEMRVRNWRLVADKATVLGALEDPAVVQLQGAPARLDLSRGEDPEQPPVHAQAQRIVYRRDGRVVVLEGDAQLVQGENELRSGRIEYEPDTDRLRAGGASGVQISLPGATVGKAGDAEG